jgi:hypothetical protein
MDEDRVHLLINPFSDPAFAPPYATLSHCWGQDPFFMLTKGTEDKLMRGIRTSILSQTFQDAISVAQSLEIQYIWIDSLCIIQDSDKDWDEQAPLMDEVYSHAFLCIAATASAKSSSGLFRTREASSRVTCEVTTAWSDRPNGVYQIYRKDQPLISRAWVVQELQLPSRILYFNSNQIFWQCHDKLACEELPRRIIPHELTAYNQENNFKLRTYDYQHQSLNKNRALPMIRRSNFMFLWRTILAHYTNCHLTFPKDKLVAISGLAKLFCGPLSDTYCAGLWVRRMPIELLWKRDIWGLSKPALPKSTRGCYRAPSWSWASIDGPVIPSYLYEDPQDGVVILVGIKSCRATTTTGDAFSELSSGVIQLSGFLSKLKLQLVFESELVTYCSVSLNGMWLNTTGSLVYTHVVLDHKPPESQEMFCFPILLRRDPYGWHLECLILVAIEGRKGTFERIGRLTIPIEEILAGYRGSELGGEDDFSLYENADRHVEVHSRDSAWHHFILSWSKHVVNPREPDDSLEFETIAVTGAVEISIQ